MIKMSKKTLFRRILIRRFNRRFLSSRGLAQIIGSGSALALLMGTTSAQAQQATPYSFGEMLQSGGVTLPLGITAKAEAITTGTGANAISTTHGQTGNNPAFMGGRLDTPPDVGFAEATYPLSGAEFATRIASINRSQLTNGTTTQYESSIGFKVTFSQPTPAAYFYGMDIDGDEWKTAFGFDNAGNFVAPNILTEPGTSNLKILPNTPIDEAGWEADIPGLNVPSELDLIVVGTFSSPVGPETTTNQVIYDFGGQALTELYFFYGLGGPASNTNPSNSGLSAFFLNVPAMEVTKTATVGALQADNTFDITYELLIENTGAAPFESFSLTDDLAAVSNLGSVFNTITPAGVTFAPVVSSGGSNFPAPNPAFDGNGASGNAELIDPADSVLFQPGDSFTLTFTANADASSIPVDLSNSAAASAQPVGFGGSLLSENSDNDSNDSNGDNPTVITAPVGVVFSIEAVDNDFTATPVAPGVGGITASIFDNDTLNGAAFTPTDVTATILDDGSLFGATINPDGTIDVPAAVAPGIYELVYEICDVNDPNLCDTAVVKVAVQTSVVDTHINPNVCGAFLSQGWITHGKLNLHDTEVQIGSGDFLTDPYLYLPIERDADGRILTYFGANDGTHSGTISTNASLPLVSTRNFDSNHESEMQVIVYRLEGAPGSTLTADLNTDIAQEFTAYWIEDTAGNVISSSDFQFTTVTPNLNAVGEQLPLSFTAPADGIAYVHVMIFDATVAYGRPVIDNYTCPAPSLSMTKAAGNAGPYAAGDVVTYTYTVTNDGNQVINNVAITDTHNGSDPAPIPGNETLLTDVAPTGDSTDAGTNNSWDVLAPGDTITFTGTYTITEIDAVNL